MEADKIEPKPVKGYDGKAWWYRLLKHPSNPLSPEELRRLRPRRKRWYRKLVADFKDFRKSEEIAVIKRRHELGLRILKHRDHVPIDLHYYLGCERSELKDCLLFAKKYPDVDAAIEEFSKELPPHAVNWFNITMRFNSEIEKAKAEERERRRRLELYNQLKAEFEGKNAGCVVGALGK